MNDLDSFLYAAPSTVFTLLCGVAAVALAYRHRRAGWLGIPVGAVLCLAATFATVGLLLYGFWDWLPLAYGALVAGIMGSRLPLPDSVIALPAAPLIAYGVSFVLDTRGADNPIGFFIAAATLGFLIGTLVSAATSLYRGWHMRRTAAHG